MSECDRQHQLPHELVALHRLFVLSALILCPLILLLLFLLHLFL